MARRVAPGDEGAALGGRAARGLQRAMRAGTLDLARPGAAAAHRGRVPRADGRGLRRRPRQRGAGRTTATWTSWPCCARCGRRSATGPHPLALRHPPGPVCAARGPQLLLDARPTTCAWPTVADQVVVMAYDTALPTPILYRRYLVLRRGPRSRPRLVRTPGPRARARRHAHLRRDRASCTAPAWRRRRTRSWAWWRPARPGRRRDVRGRGALRGVDDRREEWAVYERVWRGQDRTAALAPYSIQRP